jgi:hypothetical protein
VVELLPVVVLSSAVSASTPIALHLAPRLIVDAGKRATGNVRNPNAPQPHAHARACASSLTWCGRRDLRLIDTLPMAFCVGAALEMKAKDIEPKGSGWLIRLHERGAWTSGCLGPGGKD